MNKRKGKWVKEKIRSKFIKCESLFRASFDSLGTWDRVCGL